MATSTVVSKSEDVGLPFTNGTSKRIVAFPSQHQTTFNVTKVYKQASTFFLTRRLREAYDTLLPLVTVPEAEAEDAQVLAPVALASQSSRTKIWSLYITIVDEIIKLGIDEGRTIFGSKLWRELLAKAQSGTLWEDIVQTGYRGDEGKVDAVIVIGLSTLLLSHSSSQKLNQQRLETYLALSTNSGATSIYDSTTDSLRLSNIRIKLLEIYTLHVLPTNGEWEYAREFVSVSTELDEEHRDNFIQTLEALQEERENPHVPSQNSEKAPDPPRISSDEARTTEPKTQIPPNKSPSETGARGENDPDISSQSEAKQAESRPKQLAKKALPPSASESKPQPKPKSKRPPAYKTRREPVGLLGLMQQYAKAIARYSSPMALLRTLFFVLSLLLALSRRDVRDQIRRMTALSWNKIRGTIGMGTKVSYL